uniref:Uncharacterized protein n=1 Tax=Pinguiococcus pyrenoidosus TaxID=172671 RepID=A0A7R9U533_9STRA
MESSAHRASGWRLANCALQLYGFLLLWAALRCTSLAFWEVRPLRRYTNWNLLTFALCVLELMVRKGHSLLAAFVVPNSIAICMSFYAGLTLLEWDLFTAWAEQELQEYKAEGALNISEAVEHFRDDLGAQTQSTWMPFNFFWTTVLPELQDGLNHPLEYAAAFHAGSFVLHVIPAIIAWRSLRPRVTTHLPWWAIGALSSGFHMAWALSVNGSLYLNEIYFSAPNRVWWACWISGALTHVGVAYLMRGDLDPGDTAGFQPPRRFGRMLPKLDVSHGYVEKPREETPEFASVRRRVARRTGRIRRERRS